tara:strand:+ start:52200 stop:53807 length:1608 start_codon:yes stop_codon:yes gene_type:complete
MGDFGAYSLLPPLVAIILAIATRRVILPLAAGVFVGACLLATRHDDMPWLLPIELFVQSIVTSIASKSHLQALAFSLLLGAMVGVLEYGGAMKSLIAGISHRIRSRSGAQTMIALSGLAIFFDDYANTLLVGGTMRGTADRYRISREKLAYLVDSTAAPVAGLSIVSTWAAIEISYMAEGLHAGGIEDTSAAFEMFIQSIPYRFYPWLALVMVFATAISGRDFGPMATAEANAITSAPVADANAGEQDESAESHGRWQWLAAVMPVVACIASVGVVLVVTGMREVGTPSAEMGYLRLAGEVLGNGDSYLALIIGGAVGLGVSVAGHLAFDLCSFTTIVDGIARGAWQMMPAMLILWFAWALSAMTDRDALDTGGYLASVLSERLDPRMLPTVVFVIAGAIAFATGTSWGTMAILTPLSIALALGLDPVSDHGGGPAGAIALATCGSVLAGAIFGDHCSPISDTTVLSSRASGCDHVGHVRTQMPYALSVAVICVATGTIPAAIGLSPWISLVIGSTLIVFVVRTLGRPAIASNKN